MIFADGQTNLSTTNELHTSFILPSGTGSVALTRLATNGQQQVLDYVDYQNIGPNDSYGSFPDGQSFNRQEFFQATPGAPNNGTATPPPSFVDYTAPGSVYTQNFDSLPDPGATSVNTANTVTINGITYSLANPYDFAYPAIASGNSGGLGISALAGWYGSECFCNPGLGRRMATRPRAVRSVSARPTVPTARWACWPPAPPAAPPLASGSSTAQASP